MDILSIKPFELTYEAKKKWFIKKIIALCHHHYKNCPPYRRIISSDKNMKIINQIEKIRSKNNVNWMGLLKLAFVNAPDETLNLLKEINSKDNLITKAFKNIG